MEYVYDASPLAIAGAGFSAIVVSLYLAQMCFGDYFNGGGNKTAMARGSTQA